MQIRKRFKKRNVLVLFVFAYLLFANSCMIMRTSPKNTIKFFKKSEVSFEDKIVEIQDRPLHYIQTGKKDAHTLVFIHGSPGSWDVYKAYLTDSTFLANYRILAPDRPGFGKSGFRRSMALKPQAHLLNQLLTQLDNGEPYTLIGHSYGGPLIVQMALEKPELYASLVILAGALDPEAESLKNGVNL